MEGSMELKRTLLSAGTLAAAFAAFAAFSQPASAITCDSGEQDTTYTLSPNAGEVCGTTNNPPFGAGSVNLTFPDMAEMTYILSYKIDGEGVEGSGPITFTDPPTIDDQSGDWTISGLAEQTVIILKGGSNWAAFLVTDTTGSWSMSRDLSNASIWYKGDIVSTPIPLPASLPLFLAGLAGLGLLTRRRRKA
jgi:hypothetical protein